MRTVYRFSATSRSHSLLDLGGRQTCLEKFDLSEGDALNQASYLSRLAPFCT